MSKKHVFYDICTDNRKQKWELKEKLWMELVKLENIVQILQFVCRKDNKFLYVDKKRKSVCMWYEIAN